MSSNPKIMVFRLRELIYTAVFIVLGILLIMLLIKMFSGSASYDENDAVSTYNPGVYTSVVTFNNAAMEIKTTVDSEHINSITMENVSETITTMYPLVEPAFNDIADQIIDSQSLDNITYQDGSQYTYTVIFEAIKNTIEQAYN
ncbi:MAG: hypothetical protein ACI4DS_04465 [Eubacterium sp.]